MISETSEVCDESGNYTQDVIIALIQNELQMKTDDSSGILENDTFSSANLLSYVKKQSGNSKLLGFIVHLGKEYHWHTLLIQNSQYVIIDSLLKGTITLKTDKELTDYYENLEKKPTYVFSVFNEPPDDIQHLLGNGLSSEVAGHVTRWVIDVTLPEYTEQVAKAIELAKQDTPRVRAKKERMTPDQIEEKMKKEGDVDNWSDKLKSENAEEKTEGKTEGIKGVGKPVKIAGATFLIDTGVEATRRRAAYFSSGSGNLEDSEMKLLKHIGIDPKSTPLKQLLPEFFTSLPECQTDASLYTKLQCEVPYRVLWQSQWVKKLPMATTSLQLGPIALGELDRLVDIAPLMHSVAILEKLVPPVTSGRRGTVKSASALSALSKITI
jgi:hypothetical protein